MYLDANLMFSQNQALTATAVSDKSLFLGKEVGSGLPIFPLIQVAEPFEGLTTLEVQIQSAEGTQGTPPLEAAWKTIATSGEKTQAELNASRTINFGSLPPKSEAFLRVRYVLTGKATAGTVTAALVLDRQI